MTLTPFPKSYDDLVFGDSGMSQTFIVDGVLPSWVLPSDLYQSGEGGKLWPASEYRGGAFAIRLKRRKPIREILERVVYVDGEPFVILIDRVDGKLQLSSVRAKDQT